MKTTIKPNFQIEKLPPAPPYNLVFVPRENLTIEAQSRSFNLAMQLSMIDCKRTYNMEVIDFDDIYKKFISSVTVLTEEMTEAFFIKQSTAMFFKAGVIVFVTNFDMNDFIILMTNFKEQKSDIHVLLLVTRSQFNIWGLEDRDENVDCCVHEHSPTKSIMEKLHMTSPSH